MLALVLLLTGCSLTNRYTSQAGTLSPARAAPPLPLTDQHGQSFDLSALRGKAVLLYFGYTACPDACPTTLSDWIEVKRLLGDTAEQVAFVMVTVDPERDTPDRLGQYLAFFDPSFIGLTGDPETIQTAEREYGIFAAREEFGDSAMGYLMNHTTSYLAVDPDGKLRLIIAHGTDPEIVAEDLRHVL
jgi:protein SCO1/2